jgi:hypothetical protein
MLESGVNYIYYFPSHIMEEDSREDYCFICLWVIFQQPLLKIMGELNMDFITLCTQLWFAFL